MKPDTRPFLLFDPALDKQYGTKGALVLSLIHFRSQLVETDSDGYRWFALTHRQMLSEWFPSMGETSLQTVINSLVDRGVLLRRRANQKSWIRTMSYAVEYHSLAKQVPDSVILSDQSACSGNQRMHAPATVASYPGNRRIDPSVSGISNKEVSKDKYKEEEERLGILMGL